MIWRKRTKTQTDNILQRVSDGSQWIVLHAAVWAQWVVHLTRSNLFFYPSSTTEIAWTWVTGLRASTSDPYSLF